MMIPFTRRIAIFLLVLLGVGLGFGCQLVTSTTSALPTSAPIAVIPTLTATAPSATTNPPPTLTSAPTDTAVPTFTPSPSPLPSPTVTATPPPTNTPAPTLPPPTAASNALGQVIGFSSQGRPITAYQFKDGPRHIILVGGIHGGYEWNTILLAYEFIDYFQANPDAVPDSVTLTIIPAANPDGQYLVTGKDGRFSPEDVSGETFPGRFNGNDVDLNRNWDCNWQEWGVWRDQPIYGGPAPFSEPENQALSDFILAQDPAAVVFWHSAANGVYAAGCPDLYQPAYALALIYGEAAGYPVYESFTSYKVTGDATDWLAVQDIPAITVELKTHASLDWSLNLPGTLAVLAAYAQD